MLNICKKIGGLLLSVAFLLAGCGSESETRDREAVLDFGDRLFLVDSVGGERFVAIRSIVGADTLKKVFVLRDSAEFDGGRPLPRELSGAMVLRVPLKKVAVLSSAQIGYMLRLGLEDRIVAVGEGKYIADTALYYRVAGSAPDSLSSRIAEVGNGTSLNFEKLIAMRPDLVMTFATGGSEDDYDRMEKLGIPVMLTSEWQETSLDAKAEWLRLYGALFGVQAFADSVLGDESRDESIVNAAPHTGGACSGPKVLVGMSYGGVWHAAGGRSYTADLVKKAGGCYLWAADTSRELTLTLEEIIALADSADVWINPGMFGTPEEILAAEPRTASIKAFREKRVFQNDGRKGPGGGNDFFESAVARPLELVQNLRALLDLGLAKSSPSLTPRAPVQPADSAKTPRSAPVAFEWYHNIF